MNPIFLHCTAASAALTEMQETASAVRETSVLDAGVAPRTAWSLSAGWGGSSGLALLLLLALLAVAVIAYRRQLVDRRFLRPALVALRIAAFMLLLAMLARLELHVGRVERPILAVVIDDSQSMTATDDVDHAASPAGAAATPANASPGTAAAPAMAGNDARTTASAATHSLTPPTRWQRVQSLLSDSTLAQLAARYRIQASFVGGGAPSEPSSAALAAALRSHAATAERSPLGAAVQSAVDVSADALPGAVLLVSDGIENSGVSLPTAAAVARRRGLPLHTVLIGSDTQRIELRLDNLVINDPLATGDAELVSVQLTAEGLQGRHVVVSLHAKGEAKPLAETELDLTSPTERRIVNLLARPLRAGVVPWSVEAATRPDAQTAAHSQSRVAAEPLEQIVRVEDLRLRVLLAASAPSYEYRFLRNMLRRAQGIVLSTYLQDADTEYGAQDSAAIPRFPLRREELAAFDAIVVVDLDVAALGPSTAENLAWFVDDQASGGSLVMILGPRVAVGEWMATPLRRVLPFAAIAPAMSPAVPAGQPFRVAPTELGWLSSSFQIGASPAETRRIWSELPALTFLAATPPLSAGARVLARAATASVPAAPAAAAAALAPASDADPHLPVEAITGADEMASQTSTSAPPVIVLQYIGAGRVLVHATDETWRWRFRAEDRYFARYWLQTLHALCHERLLRHGGVNALATERAEYAPGETVRLWLRLADPAVAPATTTELQQWAVLVERADHRQDRLPLMPSPQSSTTFVASAADLPAGEYRARVLSPTGAAHDAEARFSVSTAARGAELRALRADAAAMRQAAASTGGIFLAEPGPAELLDKLPRLPPTLIAAAPPVPIWRSGWFLLALFSLLAGEWALRRRAGLP